MTETDRITFAASYNQDVFVYHEPCGDIIGVDPESLTEVLQWADQHECGQSDSDPGPKGAAEECSTERSRAPDRQPVAPVEGRAWETPQTRTV